MSEFGYIPEAPEQSFGNNKGIFTPKDIYNLSIANKWSSLGNLQLIETQILNDSSYSTTAVEFNNLGSYNVHLLTWTNNKNNGYFPMGIQMKSGGSYKTGNNYRYAMQQFADNGTFTEDRSSSHTSCRVGISAYQGNNGYAYVHNAIDSSRTTFVTAHSVQARGNLLGINGMFGGSYYSTADEVQGLRFVYEGVLHAMGGFGKFSLYGVLEE
tara:strand:- start:975 stop:1610 length:636 start_codon:yes stop_codon:yes gene_type:complete